MQRCATLPRLFADVAGIAARLEDLSKSLPDDQLVMPTASERKWLDSMVATLCTTPGVRVRRPR
jgi:hypothetical protein